MKREAADQITRGDEKRLMTMEEQGYALPVWPLAKNSSENLIALAFDVVHGQDSKPSTL